MDFYFRLDSWRFVTLKFLLQLWSYEKVHRIIGYKNWSNDYFSIKIGIHILQSTYFENMKRELSIFNAWKVIWYFVKMTVTKERVHRAKNESNLRGSLLIKVYNFYNKLLIFLDFLKDL